MPAPTVSDYEQSTWTGTATSETTASITWSAGDVIIVLGATEDNASFQLGTPTVAGLTFNAVPGTPTNTTNRCKLYAWTATAGSSSSGAITSSITGGACFAGLSAFAYTGCSGIGATGINASLGSTTVQTLVRTQANSAIVQILGDWSANADVTVSWTPAGFTQRVAQATTGATFFVGSWTDQGGTGSSNYGFTGGSGTTFSGIVLEVLGTAGDTLMGQAVL